MTTAALLAGGLFGLGLALIVAWAVVSLLLISLPERLYSRYLNAVHPILALLSGL